MLRLIAIAALLAASVAVVPLLDRITSTAPSQRARSEAYAPRSVDLAADAAGHFTVRVSVNGRGIEMLADTGASMVVLTHEDARRAGFNPGGLDYSMAASTANGEARFAPVRLDSVEVEGIVVKDVPAAVAKAGALRQSLLGMTFIGRLSGFNMEGDRLVLVE